MFENINEIFEHLEFDNEKGIRLLRILTTAGVAFIIYEHFGGALIFSKNLTLNDVVNFFFSYQVFIPILFYYLSWGIFKVSIPTFIDMLTFGLFEFFYYKKLLKLESKIIGETTAENTVEIVNIVSDLTNHLGGVRFDINRLLESEDIFSSYAEVLETVNENISGRIEKMIFLSQMIIIYYAKLEGKIIFNGGLNTLIKFTFFGGIFWQLFIVVFALFFKKGFRFLYKILLKHPKIHKKESIESNDDEQLLVTKN